ncbi:MAG: DUF3644 domain-containing protein [Actinobacteria bacterium HGW-Actinobacteria-8]|nr:MAG: DUF3644 domain-containing protein [Actinobacteria bacterium HGW-Actinobacteria-8]
MAGRGPTVSLELLTKSREAALAAVQIFNNPQVTFKSEIFVVMMNIAWTYMMHAYYRKKGIEYRYFEPAGSRRKFHRTRSGAYKYWELERCLNDKSSPIDRATSSNLRFLIGLRHEIEHQMTTRIDDAMSAKFQASCINYNDHMKSLFGDKYGIDRHLAVSLQFTAISDAQKDSLPKSSELPAHLRSFVTEFESALTQDQFEDPRFAYRILFVPKVVNHKGQADQVIEFVKSDSPGAKGLNAEYAFVKETERPKFLPSDVVRMMREEGFDRFSMHKHTELWKAKDAKNPALGFGVPVANNWYWYERWVGVVREHCHDVYRSRREQHRSMAASQ